MDINIRQEQKEDFQIVESLIERAFKGLEYSDEKEHLLTAELRKNKSFVKELSLVAEHDNKIVGHILLSKLLLKNYNKKADILSLAPVSVLPEYQNKGIGSKLIKKAHDIACSMGYHAIILIGHEDYYPRFGYKLLSKYKLKIPFEVPEKNAFIYELKYNSLKGIEGEVEYPKEFFE